MNETLVSIDTARLAEEKGFDFTGYPIIGNPATEYRKSCSLSDLRKWLRENHKIHLLVIPYKKNHQVYYRTEMGTVRDRTSESFFIDWEPQFLRVQSYEKALELTLEKALQKI